MNPLLELLLRATILLFLGLTLWGLARNRSAESRVTLLRITLAGLAILPAMWAIGPRWNFVIPGATKPDPIVLDLPLDMLVHAQTAGTEASRVDLLPAIYLGIAALLLIPALIGHIIVRRVWSNARPLTWALEDELSEALDTVGVKQLVEGRIGAIASPMVFGGLKRRILLPLNFGEWPEDHRRLALLHEAAHLKRFDCAWQHLAYGVRAVYWCHPLVWFLSRALRDETELAADERAIRSGAEAADYASALVAIARTLQEPGRLVRSQGVTFMNHRQLDRRVRSALHGRRRGFTCLGSLALMAVAAVSTYLAAGAIPQKPSADVLFAETVVLQQVPTASSISPNAVQDTIALKGQAAQPSVAKTVRGVAAVPSAPARVGQATTREVVRVNGVQVTPAPAPQKVKGVAVPAPSSVVRVNGTLFAPQPAQTIEVRGVPAAPLSTTAPRPAAVASPWLAPSRADSISLAAPARSNAITSGTLATDFIEVAGVQSKEDVEKALRKLQDLQNQSAKELAELRKLMERRADDKSTKVTTPEVLKQLGFAVPQSRTSLSREFSTRFLDRKGVTFEVPPLSSESFKRAYEGSLAKPSTLERFYKGSGERQFIVSAGSTKPVTIRVNVDGKDVTLKVTPDKDGNVTIKIDENGKITAHGG